MVMPSKLTSRKFWISVAAFLASLGTSIAGLASSEPIVITVGIACTVLSAAIYAGAEAYVDGASAAANTSSKVISASSNSNNIVQNALAPVAAPATPKEEESK